MEVMKQAGRVALDLLLSPRGDNDDGSHSDDRSSPLDTAEKFVILEPPSSIRPSGTHLPGVKPRIIYLGIK